MNQHRLDAVGRGGSQAVFSPDAVKSSRDPLKSCVFRGTRPTPTRQKGRIPLAQEALLLKNITYIFFSVPRIHFLFFLFREGPVRHYRRNAWGNELLQEGTVRQVPTSEVPAKPHTAGISGKYSLGELITGRLRENLVITTGKSVCRIDAVMFPNGVYG